MQGFSIKTLSDSFSMYVFYLLPSKTTRANLSVPTGVNSAASAAVTSLALQGIVPTILQEIVVSGIIRGLIVLAVGITTWPIQGLEGSNPRAF